MFLLLLILMMYRSIRDTPPTAAGEQEKPPDGSCQRQNLPSMATAHYWDAYGAAIRRPRIIGMRTEPQYGNYLTIR